MNVKQRGKTQRRKTQRRVQRRKTQRKTQRRVQRGKQRRVQRGKQRGKQRRKTHLKLKGGSHGIEFDDIPRRLKESKAIFRRSFMRDELCVRASMHSLFYPWYINKLRKFIDENPHILVGKIDDGRWRGTMVNIKGIVKSTNLSGEILVDIAKFDCTHILPTTIQIHMYKGVPGQGTVLDPMPQEMWTSDSEVKCQICFNLFTFTKRRHHCRSCGRVLCNECSSESLIFPGNTEEERVCHKCAGDWHAAQGHAVIDTERQMLRIEGWAPAPATATAGVDESVAAGSIIETSIHDIRMTPSGGRTFVINSLGKSYTIYIDPNPDPNLIHKMLSPRLSLPILCIGGLGFVDLGDGGPVTDARVWEFMDIYNDWCVFFDNIRVLTKKQIMDVMGDIYEGRGKKFTGYMRGMDGLELLGMEWLYKKLDILEPGGKLIHHCVFETENTLTLFDTEVSGMGPMYMPLTGDIANKCVANGDYKRTNDIRIALHHIYEYLLTPSETETTRVIIAIARWASLKTGRESGHAFLLVRTILNGIDYYCYIDAANEGEDDGISLCKMVRRPADKDRRYEACEEILQVICDLMSEDKHGDIQDIWKFTVCIPVAGPGEVVPDGNGPIEVYGYDAMRDGEIDWITEFRPQSYNTMDVWSPEEWGESNGFNERSVKHAMRDPYHAGIPPVPAAAADEVGGSAGMGASGRSARRDRGDRYDPYKK